VIVADHELASDSEAQSVYNCALLAFDVPISEGPYYVSPESLSERLSEIDKEDSRFLLLFRDIASASKAVQGGLFLSSLNLGNYSTRSKMPRKLSPGFCLGPAELQELEKLSGMVEKVYFGSLDFMNNKASIFRPRIREEALL
jgi:mannose/fructose/N-acetylgalactosamine-specific phosphotransferase system component IIB